MRLFLSDLSVVITKDFTLYFEEADLRVRQCFEFVCELFVEVRPRRASGLAVCLFLRERVKRLESPRVLVGTPCRCCGTE